MPSLLLPATLVLLGWLFLFLCARALDRRYPRPARRGFDPSAAWLRRASE